MAIKPIQLSGGNLLAKAGIGSSTPIHYFVTKTARNSVVGLGKPISKTDNEIARLKILLQGHKQKYNSLKQKLNNSFGDDWVFCYGDLDDKQSDMYIECIAQKGLMTKCQQKIAGLLKKTS